MDPVQSTIRRRSNPKVLSRSYVWHISSFRTALLLLLRILSVLSTSSYIGRHMLVASCMYAYMHMCIMIATRCMHLYIQCIGMYKNVDISCLGYAVIIIINYIIRIVKFQLSIYKSNVNIVHSVLWSQKLLKTHPI